VFTKVASAALRSMICPRHGTHDLPMASTPSSANPSTALDLDQPLPRQDSTEQELEHRDVAGLASALPCAATRHLAFSSAAATSVSPVLDPGFAPGIAVGKRARARSRAWVAVVSDRPLLTFKLAQPFSSLGFRLAIRKLV